MSTQLEIYNNALQMMGLQELETIDDDEQARRTLDQHWIVAPKYCLGEADWHFARQRMTLTRAGTAPAFQYEYAYQLPPNTDCVRIVRLYDHEPSHDSPALEAFVEENGQILTDADELYLVYVSWEKIRSKVGMWPEYFSNYIACELAKRSYRHLNAESGDNVMERHKRGRKQAFAGDAASAPPKRHYPGRWATAHNRRSHRTGQSGRRV